MEPTHGRTNFAAIASAAALIAALAAVAVAALVAWQVRQEVRYASANRGLESLWQLDDQWNSAAMLDARSAAATGLLAGRPTRDVDDVLSFFDKLTVLVNRGAVDEELAALEFSWPLANYWLASREYRRQPSSDAPTPWEEVGTMMTRLSAIAARHERRSPGDMVPSEPEVRQFLEDEQGEDECSDDDDARKTPA